MRVMAECPTFCRCVCTARKSRADLRGDVFSTFLDRLCTDPETVVRLSNEVEAAYGIKASYKMNAECLVETLRACRGGSERKFDFMYKRFVDFAGKLDEEAERPAVVLNM